MNARLIVRAALPAALVISFAACAHKAPPPPPPPPPPSSSADNNEAPPPPPPPVTSENERAVPGSERDFIINAGDRVYFDYNEVGVRDDARGVLDAQAGWLQRYPRVQVRIEGNCDERGTREYNLALGARRAEAVKAYLTSHGVSPDRITTISYGKERPLDPGTGEDAYAKNRNGHTTITGGAIVTGRFQ